MLNRRTASMQAMGVKKGDGRDKKRNKTFVWTNSVLIKSILKTLWPTGLQEEVSVTTLEGLMDMISLKTAVYCASHPISPNFNLLWVFLPQVFTSVSHHELWECRKRSVSGKYRLACSVQWHLLYCCLLIEAHASQGLNDVIISLLWSWVWLRTSLIS